MRPTEQTPWKPPGADAPRVLVVDDDAGFVQAVDIFLEDRGYRAFTAQSLAEARARLTEGAYDIVLLDVNLPDGKGTQLAHEMHSTHPDICVILMTSDESLENMRRCLDTRLMLLVKPLLPEALLDVLDYALRRRRGVPASARAS